MRWSRLPPRRGRSLGVDEAGALFVAGGAQVATDLGPGGRLARALRKAASGMPSAHLDRVGGLLDRLVIDPGGWGSGAIRTPSALSTVFAAVQADRRLRVRVYRSRGAAHGSERRLDPWGLVFAAGTWYLVAGDQGRNRAYRVDRIGRLRLLQEAVERPARLDVLALWHEVACGVAVPAGLPGRSVRDPRPGRPRPAQPRAGRQRVSR